MAPKIIVFQLIFFIFFVTSSSDPGPLNDFCIPISKNSPNSCKNLSVITVKDFVYSHLRNPGEFKNDGFVSRVVNSAVFSGLNTLGMSLVRSDFGVGGVSVPHYHPRATELAFVLEGRVYSGFVDSTNRVYAKVIQKGDVMLFPRGLMHFQMNVGNSTAAVIGSFDSQNPGVVTLPSAIFGSKISGKLLRRAFRLSVEELDKFKKRLDSSP